MGLSIRELIICSDYTCIDNFIINKKDSFADEDNNGIFSIVYVMDNLLKNFDSKIESVSSITYVSNEVFTKYEQMKKSNYSPFNITLPYGFGSYFHSVSNEKFRIISVDKAIVDKDPIFLTNHPIKELIAPFSDKFSYNPSEGVCKFKDFDYLANLKPMDFSEKYCAKIIALNGHVHSKGEEIFLNGNEEFYLENKFFIKNPMQLSEFIKVFREYGKKYKVNIQYNNNFDYSNLIFSHEGKYYLYSEATVLGEKYEKEITVEKGDEILIEKKEFFHNDRLGIITELVPDSKGVNGSKISLINYFECLNTLKTFQHLVDSKKFNSANSNSFISSISSRLGSYFLNN
ncbi:MAG: hypothetical protein WC393_02940 [Candidatus Nanoarchaeia archaeon]|jgi:hypothetical protein